MAKKPAAKKKPSGPAPRPDASRPTRQSRRPRAGAPAALEQEITIASGREMLMGISPLQKQNEYLFYTVDDIIRKKGGFQEYRNMLNDDAVKAALWFKKILVYGRKWDVDPASDSETDGAVADFVTWNLKRARLKRIVRDALTALDYGFSYGEIIWELATYKGKPCIALKTIKFRDPEGARLYVDKHGNLVRVEQEDVFGRLVDIPLPKTFHYAYHAEFGSVYGKSDLRAVYKNWWAKKYLVNFWNVYLERLGAPTLLMKYPGGASQQLKDTLKTILKDLGNRAEILVPDGVKVDVLESTRAGQATYNEALIYHDAAIGRGLLMPALLGIGKETARGSDSQSRLQLRTMFKVTDEIGNEITEVLCSQVIKQLIDYNFEVTEYPDLIWQDYGEYEAFEIADVIRLLHNAGIIDMDQEDVNYVRSVVGLPTRDRADDEDEVLRPEPAPMGTGAAPPTTPGAGGAKQGNEGAKTGGSKTGGAGGRENRPVRNSSRDVLLRLEAVERAVLKPSDGDGD